MHRRGASNDKKDVETTKSAQGNEDTSDKQGSTGPLILHEGSLSITLPATALIDTDFIGDGQGNEDPVNGKGNEDTGDKQGLVDTSARQGNKDVHLPRNEDEETSKSAVVTTTSAGTKGEGRTGPLIQREGSLSNTLRAPGFLGKEQGNEHLGDGQGSDDTGDGLDQEDTSDGQGNVEHISSESFLPPESLSGQEHHKEMRNVYLEAKLQFDRASAQLKLKKKRQREESEDRKLEKKLKQDLAAVKARVKKEKADQKCAELLEKDVVMLCYRAVTATASHVLVFLSKHVNT